MPRHVGALASHPVHLPTRMAQQGIGIQLILPGKKTTPILQPVVQDTCPNV